MNNSALFVMLNFILIAIEVSVVAYLADGFFSRKNSDLVYFASFFSLVILTNLNAYFFESLTSVRISCTMLLYFVWILINYRESIIKCIFFAVLLVSFQCSIDNLFLIFTYSSATQFSTLESPYAYYFICYGSKLLELLIVAFIHAWAKRRFQNQSGSWQDWLRILFFPFSTFLIDLCLTTILFQNPQLAGALLICTFILLLSDAMSIVLLNYLERQQAMLLDNAILRQSLKIESEHIRSLQESYSSQRKQTHDFNNQLAVLRSMADHNAPQEVFSEYLSHILAIEFPSIIYVNTHRMVVDIILSQKCTLAKNKKIDLELRLDDLSNFPLPDDALVIVLTNLIDNAMEACEKILTPSQRKIILTMQVKPMASFLRIENTTAEPVHISHNTIATTKTDSFAHGYGLKNVCTMLERHGGMYAMAYREDGTFCFSSKISTN